MLVQDGLLRAALRSPSAPALMLADEVVSFGELADTADRLAGALASIAAPGTRVVLVAENSAGWVECMYAVPMAGQVFVPLNYRLSAGELVDQVNVCRASVLVCDRVQFDRLRPGLARAGTLREVVVIGSARWAELRGGTAGGQSRTLPAPVPADVAWLIFTSGTSGRAKGTLLTHRSLGTAMVANSFGRPIRPDDVYISAYPLCHVSAMNVPLYHLHGRPVVLMPRFRADAFAVAARQHRATTTTLAPTMLGALLDHLDTTGTTIPTLRRVGYGAAPMRAALLDRARKRLDVHLTESYGMTELSGAVTFDGVPSPLAVVRVVDDELTPLPAGVPGEIVVSGDQVAAGYWDEPALSSAAFRGGWLHTGDLGQFDDAGVLHIVGRLKDVIITGGENVMAREVEAALEQHPLVQAAAVIGVPDERWGEAVCAFVVPAASPGPTAEEIGAHVTACLGSFKRPRVVHFVAGLPLGMSGKVAKDELRRRAAELQDLSTERKGLTLNGNAGLAGGRRHRRRTRPGARDRRTVRGAGGEGRAWGCQHSRGGDGRETAGFSHRGAHRRHERG